MRERSPEMWEIVVQAGVDPVTGRRRQVSRVFRGNLRDAKKARAELLTEVSHGRHTGSSATVDELFADWIVELRRKGRSPNTIRGYEYVYRHNIQARLGKVPVRKVTTKQLTDLYGAHQARGLSARSVYQVHACCSSMFTQACKWGWRDANPAQWADPPPKPNITPVVPSPDDVMTLVAAAKRSRRPEYSRAIFIAATTGVRRAELCALRRSRDIDWDRGVMTVTWSIVDLKGEPLRELPTKNRRSRPVALDEATLAALREQVEFLEDRAEAAGVELAPDAYLFSDAPDGTVPWKPGAITHYFARLRTRVGLDDVYFHHLRKFMETYGQNLGFSAVQVALRAGHDPSVAARHYTGSLLETDRALATAVAALLLDPTPAEQ
jgi:integrase